jgi:hypothetical protein
MCCCRRRGWGAAAAAARSGAAWEKGDPWGGSKVEPVWRENEAGTGFPLFFFFFLCGVWVCRELKEGCWIRCVWRVEIVLLRSVRRSACVPFVCSDWLEKKLAMATCDFSFFT